MKPYKKVHNFEHCVYRSEKKKGNPKQHMVGLVSMALTKSTLLLLLFCFCPRKFRLGGSSAREYLFNRNHGRLPGITRRKRNTRGAGGRGLMETHLPADALDAAERIRIAATHRPPAQIVASFFVPWGWIGGGIWGFDPRELFNLKLRSHRCRFHSVTVFQLRGGSEFIEQAGPSIFHYRPAFGCEFRPTTKSISCRESSL